MSRKTYAALSETQRSVKVGDTVALNGGETVVNDVIRLSDKGRWWVGQLTAGDWLGARSQSLIKFNSEDVTDVLDSPLATPAEEEVEVTDEMSEEDLIADADELDDCGPNDWEG
jgi:hypothetical protein